MSDDRSLRVCIVYDCLHPWTVGGEERWLRDVAETLAAQGHEVTYLTRRQWPLDEPPSIPGVNVVAVARFEPLYDENGNRHPSQALRFGLGVFRHLLGHRNHYDVIHTCGFPYFHLPAVRVALAGTGVPAIVDWPEVWSPGYWRGYVGGVGGRVGYLVQRACVRLSAHALTYSRRYGERLLENGFRGEAHVPGGLGPALTATPPRLTAAAPPTIVFAGRHIREKRTDVVPAVAVAARNSIPELRAEIFGNGPERPAVLRAIDELDAGAFVSAPGFVDAEVLEESMRGATALVHPSNREGFGIVVLEATAAGTPVVLVDGPDNAAAELIVEGVNGYVASDAEPATIAAAVVKIHLGGEALRRSAAQWYVDNAERLSAHSTAKRIESIYREILAAQEAGSGSAKRSLSRT